MYLEGGAEGGGGREGGRNIKCPLQVFLKLYSVPLFLTFKLFILVCVILSHAESMFWVTWFGLLIKLSDIFRGVKNPRKVRWGYHFWVVSACSFCNFPAFLKNPSVMGGHSAGDSQSQV